MTERINGIHKKLIEATATVAAEKAAAQTLKGLGVDVDHPLAMQRDFQHLRKSREGVEQTRKVIKRSAIGAVITVVVPGAIYALWEAWKR